MYASSVVSQRIELIQAELNFRPEYHTPSEIDDFERRIESRYVDAYNGARRASQGAQDPVQAFQTALSRTLCNPEAPKLHPDEVRWMQNERALAMCDAAYFLTRYFYIKTPQAVQRFTFLPGQRIYFDVVSEIEATGAAIELIIDKARQHGVSTETEGLVLQRACFGYGTNCVVASADRQKTGKMAQMMLLGYDMLPWWMRAPSTRRVESDQGMLVFGGSRSGISFQHGAQTSGIARGDTVKIYHLSEVASYTNPEEQIESSLFRCVHPHPDVFGALESTAEGDTGWFYDTYWYSKKEWKNRRSRLCALFLPWFLGTDKYPTPTWIRTRPVPQDWRPEPETRAMIARAKIYIQSNPVLERVLGAKWELPQHQAWYWECNFLEHRAKGKEKLWAQEMPTDDKESFQGSYDNVFGREVIAQADSDRRTEYHVYGIIGQSIEDRHEPDPDEVDYDESRIPVSYEARRGEVYRWELVPLHWKEPFETIDEIRDDDGHMGKFFVYLPPEIGYDYSIGVDTSNGIGRDHTVIAVSRRGRDPQEPDEQAAEFRSDRVSHVEAYAWVGCIAAYFARYMGSHGVRYREPYISIEQIAAVGDTCQLQLQKLGFSRLHIPTRYDTTPQNMRKSGQARRGWFTSSWSRAMLVDSYVAAVVNGWYRCNSFATLAEMAHWEVHLTAGGKSKLEHPTDYTDDGIFANAMAFFCPNDLQSMAKKTKNRGPIVARRKPDLDVTPTKEGMHVSCDIAPPISSGRRMVVW